MASIENIKGSDGVGSAGRATVTGTRAASNPTITVDSLANWPSTFIGVTGTLDTATNLITSETLQIFFGHESGGTIIIDSFAAGSTDLGNAIGDIVILKPTTAWADELATILEVAHDDDGGLNSTALAEATAATKTALEADANFRTTPRISTTASTATLTADIDTYNIYSVSAQAAGITIADPTGTPNDGDIIVIRLKDDGTTRAITYGSAWSNISGLDSLTDTVVSKWSVIGAMWNAGTSKWQIISITTEA